MREHFVCKLCVFKFIEPVDISARFCLFGIKIEPNKSSVSVSRYVICVDESVEDNFNLRIRTVPVRQFLLLMKLFSFLSRTRYCTS